MAAFSRMGEAPGVDIVPPFLPAIPADPAEPGIPLAPRVTIGLLSLSIIELNCPDGMVVPAVLDEAGVRYVEGLVLSPDRSLE